jgi:GrpB-like predicted nucleotidyltransferase (UPF0157 family)
MPEALVAGSIRAPVIAAGWECPESINARLSARRFFVRREGGERAAHVHVVPIDDPEWSDPIRFRDRLRADPDLVARYEQLKRDLAERFRHDRDAYTAGKHAFVVAVVHGREPPA